MVALSEERSFASIVGKKHTGDSSLLVEWCNFHATTALSTPLSNGGVMEA